MLNSIAYDSPFWTGSSYAMLSKCCIIYDDVLAKAIYCWRDTIAKRKKKQSDLTAKTSKILRNTIKNGNETTPLGECCILGTLEIVCQKINTCWAFVKVVKYLAVVPLQFMVYGVTPSVWRNENGILVFESTETIIYRRNSFWNS